MIVTADEDGVNTAPLEGIVGEVDGDEGSGGVETDVLEKVRILEVVGNAYFPVPTMLVVVEALRLFLPEVVVEVTLFLPEELDKIDLCCKFPDNFFFNPPAGNGGNDFSLFNTPTTILPLPLLDDIIGGADGLKISFGVLGMGILNVEEVDEGVFPLTPLLLFWLLLLLLPSC